MRIGVLVNTGKELGAGLEALRGLLAQAGHPDPDWREVSRSRKAPKQVLEMVDAGIDRLLVWGGDGTVRRCIHTLLDAEVDGVEIAILPAGTANLLARNLGIPVDLDGAVRVAIKGTPAPIDVGVMNGEHFAVTGGTGFDAVLIGDVERGDAKDRWGRLAHVRAAWRNLRLPPAGATVDVDGDRWFEGPATMVLVANVPTTLGGLRPFPAAEPDDGALDLAVVRAHNRRQWLRVLAAVVARRTSSSPLGEVTAGRRIEITLDRKLPWQVDGGERSRERRFSVHCLPAAIRICRPDPVDGQDG